MTRVRLAVAVCLLAAAAAAPAPAATRHRGVSWVAGREVTASSFAPLVADHVDWIVQTPFGWQTAVDSPEVRLATDGRIYWGERDEGIETTTRLAHAAGIHTMLKPHIWLHRSSAGGWRGEIEMKNEEDWRRWFESYRVFILHYARLAETNGVEALCVGTELHKTAVQRPDDWRRLIADVRAVYHGKVLYAANWYREFEEIPFWDRLDYIGIQAYFPLSDGSDPSVEALRAAWLPHLQAIEKVQAKYGKPVLFTEIGYRSAPDTAIEPWKWPDRPWRRGVADAGDASGGLRGLKAQDDAYRAFFETFWNRSWFAGAYIWKWYPDGAGRARDDFTPQGKPAERTMAAWYARSAAPAASDNDTRRPR